MDHFSVELDLPSEVKARGMAKPEGGATSDWHEAGSGFLQLPSLPGSWWVDGDRAGRPASVAGMAARRTDSCHRERIERAWPCD
jgi:hypothetical protein